MCRCKPVAKKILKGLSQTSNLTIIINLQSRGIIIFDKWEMKRTSTFILAVWNYLSTEDDQRCFIKCKAYPGSLQDCEEFLEQDLRSGNSEK